MESRPPVSLVGGPGEGRAPDVLASGKEAEPRLSPAARRRLRLGSVVILVGIAVTAGGLEVRERRQTAAEERRLAGVLMLSSPEEPWRMFAEAESPSAPSINVEMRVPVRNDGPRDVVVTHARAGGLVFLRPPVRLGAQSRVELVMQETVECGADSPSSSGPGDPMAAPGPLEITAETSDGVRTITIDRPIYDGEYAERLCFLMRGGVPPPAP